MRTMLGVLGVWLVGCAGGEMGTVKGKVARAPEAEISFVPELELRPFLERRAALRVRLAQLSVARQEAECEYRRATDESLLRRLWLLRAPPPPRELALEKQRLTARTEAACSRRRALNEEVIVTWREASLPPPPAALTVSAGHEGHFEAELPAGRYGVAVKRLGADGRLHTSLTWTEVGSGEVGSVEEEGAALDE